MVYLSAPTILSRVEYQTEIEPELRRHTTSGKDTLLGRLGLSIEKLEWDRPDVRALCLTMDTYLFLCYHLLVIVLVRRARLAAQRKDTANWREYSKSAVLETGVYKDTLNGRIDWWNTQRSKLIKWRNDQVQPTESIVSAAASEVPEVSSFPEVYYQWQDQYSRHGFGPVTDEPAVEKQRTDYIERLQKHIEKVLKGDKAIVDSWQKMLDGTHDLLKPLQPAKAPAILVSPRSVRRHESSG